MRVQTAAPGVEVEATMTRALAIIASIVVLAIAPFAAVNALGPVGADQVRQAICLYPFMGSAE
jgi:hypothetical protein